MNAKHSPLYAFANRFGRRPGTGLIVDVLDRAGSVRDASTRMWPQTEAIKAHTVMAARGFAVASGQPPGEIIAQIVNNLLKRFFAREPRGTWTEHFTPSGKPKGDRIPSSSLYHILRGLC